MLLNPTKQKTKKSTVEAANARRRSRIIGSSFFFKFFL